jgi:hypothetical protein
LFELKALHLLATYYYEFEVMTDWMLLFKTKIAARLNHWAQLTLAMQVAAAAAAAHADKINYAGNHATDTKSRQLSLIRGKLKNSIIDRVVILLFVFSSNSSNG